MTKKQTTTEAVRGQVSPAAATVYEEFFVPALFEQWAGRVLSAARVQRGQRVLDVACGTGVLARHAADRVGPGGNVIGLDVNEGMLDVARSLAPEIEWRHGRAESLPFDDSSFDAVISQFGMMFFDDKTTALREMYRVLRPGGHLAVAVWDSLDRTPGYAALYGLLRRLFGEPVADALRAPYSLGDYGVLTALFDDAGVPDAHITTRQGMARFPSIDSWMHTDIKGWTLADMIDDDQYEHLRREAHLTLQPFVMDGGRVEFSAPAHIVSAHKH
jgi:ubiquinone/menaquinone biosynthesis C-methylase UbiE